MYVWQGRYRKERLNVVAETLHQQEVDEALDEALRHRLELEFVETSLQNIDTAIRKYLETADGSAEVDLVMPMMKLGRSLTSIHHQFKLSFHTTEDMTDSQLLSRAFGILSPDELELMETKFYAVLENLESKSGLHFNKDFFVTHFQTHSSITRDEIFTCTTRFYTYSDCLL